MLVMSTENLVTSISNAATTLQLDSMLELLQTLCVAVFPFQHSAVAVPVKATNSQGESELWVFTANHILVYHSVTTHCHCLIILYYTSMDVALFE